MPSTIANLLSKVEHPGHLNSKVVLHIGEEIGKYTTINIKSLSFERLTNGVGNFTMSLVDPDWVEIERKILNARGQGWFEYGYENNLSMPIKIQIVGMELDPYLNYVVLNLSGFCLGTKLLENSQFLSSVKQTTAGSEITSTGVVQSTNRTLHDFVIDLAKSAGFKEENIFVDKTTIPIAKEGLFGTEDLPKIFNSKGMNLFTFLVRQILPYAITPEDSKKLEDKKTNPNSTEAIKITPFVFYIRMNDKGEEEFHFHKQDKYKDDPKLVRVFDLYSDPETRIISYKPSYEHMLANITRGTSVFAWTYSPLSGTEFEESNYVEQSPSAIQPFLDYAAATGDPAKDFVNKPSEASKILLYSPDPSLNKLKAARALQLSTNAPLTAELVIVGDPTFNICDCIDINVNIPFGKSKGNPHDTSNRYMILGIIDTIDMGVFTTRLDLGTAHGSTDRGKEAATATKEEEQKAKLDAQKKKIIENEKK